MVCALGAVSDRGQLRVLVLSLQTLLLWLWNVLCTRGQQRGVRESKEANPWSSPRCNQMYELTPVVSLEPRFGSHRSWGWQEGLRL